MCETPIKQDATYQRCPLVTVTVATHECTQRSAFGSFRVEGECHTRTEGLRKCCWEKFLIGAEIFFGFDNIVFFFGEISNGTALFCVGFVQLGR